MDLSPRSILLGFLVVAVVAIVGAVSGAVSSVAYQAVSSRGERARFGDLVEPLRAEVDALDESFRRMRARNAKRVKDEKEDDEPQMELQPGTDQEREVIKARIRAIRRGA